jgi:hypothetical protein
MDNVRLALRLLHFLAWGALLGGLFAASGNAEKKLAASTVWGARLAFVTGLLLTGIKEALAKAPGGTPVDHAKIGIKLLLGLAVTGMIEASQRKGMSDGMRMGAIAVSVLAMAVAIFWK